MNKNEIKKELKVMCGAYNSQLEFLDQIYSEIQKLENYFLLDELSKAEIDFIESLEDLRGLVGNRLPLEEIIIQLRKDKKEILPVLDRLVDKGFMKKEEMSCNTYYTFLLKYGPEISNRTETECDGAEPDNNCIECGTELDAKDVDNLQDELRINDIPPPHICRGCWNLPIGKIKQKETLAFLNSILKRRHVKFPTYLKINEKRQGMLDIQRGEKK